MNEQKNGPRPSSSGVKLSIIMDAIQPFVYTASPVRVIFHAGSIKCLDAELDRLSVCRPLLLSTPQQADDVSALSKYLHPTKTATTTRVFAEAAMHTPVEITARAVEYALQVHADSLVSLGGGSTIGLGKALASRMGLPHICIPTTYAGSEMTPILGETENGVKTTKSDPSILPSVVIYDVHLTMTLPASMSATSGVNSIAHAIEALYSPSGNPIITLLALECIRCLAIALPALQENPHDLTARTSAQYGAWLGGLCLGSVGMCLHHKLCHTLGGSFNMPHAETHTVVLPHAIAYNSTHIPPQVMASLATVLPESNGDAVAGLNALLHKLKVERSLRAFGFREADIETAAEIATSKSYPNPRPVERAPMIELIRRVWAGEPAKADL